MKCVILAAGSARRMRPISEEIPKCLLVVGGKPILQRTIELVHAAGIEDIGLVVGYKAAAVRQFDLTAPGRAWINQRKSTRRRSTPELEHGASTKTRSACNASGMEVAVRRHAIPNRCAFSVTLSNFAWEISWAHTCP